MLFAAAQTQSSDQPEENLAKARQYVEKAKKRGASFILFPENLMAWVAEGEETSIRIRKIRELAQPLDGPFVQGLAAIAREHQIWIVGNILESSQQPETRPYNTAIILNDEGKLVGTYRKTHLFDSFGFQESASIKPGLSLFEPIDTPFARLGLFVCYDLRFPEIARHQVEQGADILLMTSGWVGGNLKEHQWRHLIIARAIENTTYLFACNHANNHYIGRSLLVDPMGVVLAEGNEGEDLIFAEFDLERLAAVRKRVPSLTHRRPELYQATKNLSLSQS